MNSKETRQVRAYFDDATIVVYQAFNESIARQAAAQQNFLFDAFKSSRMTWIKPSFCWMMYRSGWASKPNQEHILAITLSREGFDWALAHACLSHFDAAVHASPEAWRASLETSPVRIQWDPERDLHLQPLPKERAIQLGLSGNAVIRYMHEWIVRIDDITALCRKAKKEIDTIGYSDALTSALPSPIRQYPVSDEIRQRLGMTT